MFRCCFLSLLLLVSSAFGNPFPDHKDRVEAQIEDKLYSLSDKEVSSIADVLAKKLVSELGFIKNIREHLSYQKNHSTKCTYPFIATFDYAIKLGSPLFQSTKVVKEEEEKILVANLCEKLTEQIEQSLFNGEDPFSFSLSFPKNEYIRLLLDSTRECEELSDLSNKINRWINDFEACKIDLRIEEKEDKTIECIISENETDEKIIFPEENDENLQTLKKEDLLSLAQNIARRLATPLSPYKRTLHFFDEQKERSLSSIEYYTFAGIGYGTKHCLKSSLDDRFKEANSHTITSLSTIIAHRLERELSENSPLPLTLSFEGDRYYPFLKESLGMEIKNRFAEKVTISLYLDKEKSLSMEKIVFVVSKKIAETEISSEEIVLPIE